MVLSARAIHIKCLLQLRDCLIKKSPEPKLINYKVFAKNVEYTKQRHRCHSNKKFVPTFNFVDDKNCDDLPERIHQDNG